MPQRNDRSYNVKSLKVILIAAALLLCAVQLSIGQGIAARADSATGTEPWQGSQTLKARLADLVSESYRTYKLSIDEHWKLGVIDRLVREREVDALNQWTKKTRQTIREADDKELVVLSHTILGAGSDADSVPAAAHSTQSSGIKRTPVYIVKKTHLRSIFIP